MRAQRVASGVRDATRAGIDSAQSAKAALGRYASLARHDRPIGPIKEIFVPAKNDDIPFPVPSKKRSPRPAALVGIVAVVVVVAICIGTLLFDAVSAPPSFEVVKAEATDASDAGADGEQPAAEKTILVHVGGEVRAPGLYEIAQGSRVNDAIEAAGGFTDDASRDAVNLAREVADGEQIIVAAVEEVERQASAASSGSVPGGSSASGAAGAQKKVNINTASAEELDSLPGIGASTAQKIVADRAANGPFKTIEDLKRVTGIGEKKFAQLADSITVG